MEKGRWYVTGGFHNISKDQNTALRSKTYCIIAVKKQILFRYKVKSWNEAV